jgi:AraC-like DNA-binding protein
MNHEAPLAGTKRGFWNQHADATRVGLDPISTGYCPTLQAAALHLEGVMSFQAMAWATKIKLPTHEKFVLIMLSNYADEHGKCWPSIETLCNETGMSRPTVKRALRKLVERKLLIKAKRVKGHLQTSNLYVLEWG